MRGVLQNKNFARNLPDLSHLPCLQRVLHLLQCISIIRGNQIDTGLLVVPTVNPSTVATAESRSRL
jgi:hypothetical protein